jgi:hypothetical protein
MTNIIYALLITIFSSMCNENDQLSLDVYIINIEYARDSYTSTFHYKLINHGCRFCIVINLQQHFPFRVEINENKTLKLYTTIISNYIIQCLLIIDVH